VVRAFRAAEGRGRRQKAGSRPGAKAMTRSHLVAFRLTPEEHACLAAAARPGRLAPAAWCRRTVLEQLAAAVPPPVTVTPLAATPPSTAPLASTEPQPPVAGGVPAAGPAQNEPLSRVVGARLTPSLYFDLETRAKGAGVTVGTYLRHLVRGHPPTARWPLARAAIVQLARVGNNLNQLVKLAHSGAPLSLELYAVVQQVLAEVRRVRRALQVEPRG
jgi:mobilization protein NikA